MMKVGEVLGSEVVGMDRKYVGMCQEGYGGCARVLGVGRQRNSLAVWVSLGVIPVRNFLEG